MRKALVFEAQRMTYSLDYVLADASITISALRDLLEDYDDEDIFVLSHDNGYTYGSICEVFMQEMQEKEDGTWEEV